MNEKFPWELDDPPPDNSEGKAPEKSAEIPEWAKPLIADLETRKAKDMEAHDQEEITTRRKYRRSLFDAALEAVTGERKAADRKRRSGINLFGKL